VANKATISKKDERLLHTKSGNRCAKCNIVLVDRSVCVGQNAHIYGEKPDAARYDISKSVEYVNSEKNLIFLCSNFHKIVDTDVLLFPAKVLFKMKSDHEHRVIQALQKGSLEYTYAELEVITSFLVQEIGKKSRSVNFELLRLQDKIEKNQLVEVQGYIDIGLLSVSSVEYYLNRQPDPSFAGKLTRVFVEKYNDLKRDGNDAISIFNSLWDFACNDQSDYKYRSAGLALLVYFFEKCEVFEK
jgi:hypothetical protein